MEHTSVEKDNGDWLSAQQAVQADGTEVGNLPLINKKLPPLSGALPSDVIATVESTQIESERSNATMTAPHHSSKIS